MIDLLQRARLVAALSLAVALAAPAAVFACAGSGGGGEEAGIDLTPNTQNYGSVEAKAFTIKSYRFSATTISSISVNAPEDYTINDPNGCKGKTLNYLGTCKFSVIGSSSSTHWASLGVQGKNSQGQVVAWDASVLNAY